MGRRNIVAVLILILGTAASFYCYSRLSQLLPMSVVDMVTKTEATVTQVTLPMVKKGGAASDTIHDVRFHFHAAGKRYEGGFTMARGETVPALGAKLPVVYYTSRPNIFLQQEAYDDLPRQLMALRVMMISFALIAVIAPFGVMKHG